jgi:dUTP pyrophosphatase
MDLKVTKLDDTAVLPEYAHPGDSGLDLFSLDDEIIAPSESGLIHTGIAIELPKNTEAQVRPRSGLALKHQITVLNSPGTIDEGYRGEICVILINHGKQDFHVSRGMKIAQMVISPVTRVQVKEINRLGITSRGSNGFGSTGVNTFNSDSSKVEDNLLYPV